MSTTEENECGRSCIRLRRRDISLVNYQHEYIKNVYAISISISLALPLSLTPPSRSAPLALPQAALAEDGQLLRKTVNTHLNKTCIRPRTA